MATFDEFLSKGRFGPLSIGMTKDDVRGLLGEPGDVSIAKNPEIWKFDPLEIAFYRTPANSSAVLASVTYYTDRAYSLPPDVVDISAWLPTSDTSFDDLRSRLDQLKVAILSSHGGDPTSMILTRDGVIAVFNGDKLLQIGFTSRDRPEYKQVSVTVRMDELVLIQQEAKSRGISISALCSLWVGERATSLKGQTGTTSNLPVAHQQA